MGTPQLRHRPRHFTRQRAFHAGNRLPSADCPLMRGKQAALLAEVTPSLPLDRQSQDKRKAKMPQRSSPRTLPAPVQEAALMVAVEDRVQVDGEWRGAGHGSTSRARVPGALGSRLATHDGGCARDRSSRPGRGRGDDPGLPMARPPLPAHRRAACRVLGPLHASDDEQVACGRPWRAQRGVAAAFSSKPKTIHGQRTCGGCAPRHSCVGAR